MYMVNGYKFQPEVWNEGKATYNYGVCTKWAGTENNFYGILKDVLEIMYPRKQIKKCFSLVVISLIIPPMVIQNAQGFRCCAD